MESTLVLIKPDGVARKLCGEIIGRLERKNLELTEARLFTPSRELASEHYAEHASKPFFGELLEFITSGPVFALNVSGPDAVKVVRNLIGATNPVDSAPGTIRGDLGIVMTENLVHGSDSLESAQRELTLWFR